jgi:hypothetical protein
MSKVVYKFEEKEGKAPEKEEKLLKVFRALV